MQQWLDKVVGGVGLVGRVSRKDFESHTWEIKFYPEGMFVCTEAYLSKTSVFEDNQVAICYKSTVGRNWRKGDL